MGIFDEDDDNEFWEEADEDTDDWNDEDGIDESGINDV